MLQRFTNKIAVVTGGAQGIGRATAERLGREGGAIFIVDRAAEAAHATAKALKAEGLDVEVEVADLSTWAGASTAFDAIIRKAGRIDVLVNNVGGTIWIKPFLEYTEDEIKAEIDRSLWPTIWSCRAVAPHMVSRGTGSIVNVGSNSVRGIYRIPYATSKGGVMGLTTSLAIELAETGVRVNCVAPGGGIETDALVRWMETLPGGRPSFERMSVRGKFGLPEEIAAAVLFLATDEASLINGAILPVDGGATARVPTVDLPKPA